MRTGRLAPADLPEPLPLFNTNPSFNTLHQISNLDLDLVQTFWYALHKFCLTSHTTNQWLALAFLYDWQWRCSPFGCWQHEDGLSVLTLGPCKKVWVMISTKSLVYWNFMMLLTSPLSSCHADPLVSYGCHFGHKVHMLCNVQTLITKGLLCRGEQATFQQRVSQLSR